MVQLPTDPDDYDRRTELLQIANFVDLSTRAVFLEMGVWNNNLGLFGVVRQPATSIWSVILY